VHFEGIVPSLDTPTLEKLAAMFEDETNERKKLMTEEHVEIYITCLLCLNHRQSGNASVSKLATKLEMVLRQRFRMYRPTNILYRCMDWKFWPGVSVIYELLNDRREAFQWRLHGLKDLEKGQRMKELEEHILPLMISFCSTASVEVSTQIFRELLHVWIEEALDGRYLEEYVLKNALVLVEPVCRVIQSSTDEMLASLSLSPQFYLNLIESFIKTSRSKGETE
jgi:hypothetical protein